MPLSIVILAAGLGKRMQSLHPKILHTVGDKTLLEHVVATATLIHPSEPPIVIYGHQKEQVLSRLSHLKVSWVHQEALLGTGHAVMQALPFIPDDHSVLILYGDVPLITENTLQKLVRNTPKNALGLVTAVLPDPYGFGRIIRDANGNIQRVVEEKDANEKERALKEINSGIYYVQAHRLRQWLPQVNNNNAQQEYYLPDIIQKAVQEHILIHNEYPKHYEEILGVNNCVQLAEVERYYQRRLAEKLMLQGVTLKDPNRLDIRGELVVGRDVTFDINVIIEGKVFIGDHCSIGSNTLLRDVTLGESVEIKSNCVIEGAEIDAYCTLGPFARIRPGTRFASHVSVGNFIEIKNSIIDAYTKIHHVGYIGDSEVGQYVNIGAGTITCNYDGANKHKTRIGDHAFIGSNTELVAPVTVGSGAYIGAGSTITRDAPAGQLTLTRGQQRTIENWQPKKKED